MRTGLAAKAVDAVDQWIGRVPGRLSLSAVGGGTLFGALSGASMASVAMLGSTLVPEMTKRKYKPTMSVGAILGGGGLAVLIPPSALGVLLGALAKVSIAELLLAGILPGLLLALLYFAYFTTRAYLQPELAPPYIAEKSTLGAKMRALLEVTPLAQTRIANYTQWQSREQFLNVLRSDEMRRMNRKFSDLSKGFEPVLYEVHASFEAG